MMKLFYLTFLTFLFFTACSQSDISSPMLWKITGNNIKKPSYLFGTFHTKDPSINNLPYSVTSSLSRSQRLYTEISISKKSTNKIVNFSKLSKPSILKKRLHPKTIKKLLAHLKKTKSQQTLKTLSLYKTWSIALMLLNQTEDKEFPNALFMDETLIAYAKKKHIKQAALETPLEQLKYFDMLNASLQEQLLLDTLHQEVDNTYTQALKVWYLKGKAKGFYTLQARFSSSNPKQQKLDKTLNKGLLIGRNTRFTRRINILLQNNSSLSYFFAIGAGHMSGEKGIIKSLRVRGYTIKKID